MVFAVHFIAKLCQLSCGRDAACGGVIVVESMSSSARHNGCTVCFGALQCILGRSRCTVGVHQVVEVKTRHLHVGGGVVRRVDNDHPAEEKSVDLITCVSSF